LTQELRAIGEDKEEQEERLRLAAGVVF